MLFPWYERQRYTPIESCWQNYVSVSSLNRMVAMTVHDTFCVKYRLVYDPCRQATVMTARWSCLNGFFVSLTPPFDRVALFPSVLTRPLCCTACGRLLVCHSHSHLIDYLRPATSAESSAKGFYLNNAHTFVLYPFSRFAWKSKSIFKKVKRKLQKRKGFFL
jgi:hypothetical protein